MNKPFSESCVQNRDVILSVIEPLFINSTDVLEIGSGTGQHAVFFAKMMPHLIWHTSDIQESHSGIRMWFDEAELNNIEGPYLFDVVKDALPTINYDAVFTANTLHIMSWDAVSKFFEKAGRSLPEGGDFIIYGPFNYNNKYTSESNKNFDAWLKRRNEKSGIRNYEDLLLLADKENMKLINDYEMPVNNRILHWRKHHE